MDETSNFWMHAMLTTLALTNLAAIWVAVNYVG
jgi:hypothetical protein